MMEYKAKWQAWCLWAILWVGAFLAPASWGAQYAIFFSLAGLLLLLGRGPEIRVRWAIPALILALLFWVCFLPASVFPQPQWRETLSLFGIESSSQVIQREMAAEMGVVLMLMLGVGLWLAARRYSRETLKSLALAFSLGVSVYALVSWILRDHLTLVRGGDHFGFFPNRNHSATFLAMGVFSSVGCLVQDSREKRVMPAVLAGTALVVILVALIFWSESRAGIILLLVGASGFVILARPTMIGRNAVVALGLVLLLGAGLFALSESRVKERITATISPKDARNGASSDFRIPTWRDTWTMLQDAPLSGVGAGQFRFVFPQYKNHTAIEQRATSYHPESDWLWVAAESGIPAALVMGGMVLSAAAYSMRNLRVGRSRALRAGCLVAALILPIHGLFDVPGHRIVLIWSACWLYALSLPPFSKEEEGVPGWISRALWKCVGLATLVVGLYFVNGTWFGGRVPTMSSADDALHHAQLLVESDDQLRAEAHARGDVKYDPSPESDPLEKAYSLLGEAAHSSPLDIRLYRGSAEIGLQFNDKYIEVDRLLMIERSLNPKNIEILIEQGKRWEAIDSVKAENLWRDATELAIEVDRILGLGGHIVGETESKIPKGFRD